MPLFRAITAVRGEAAAHALSDALDEIDPAPLAGEIHDHDDGSGLWDVGGLFDAGPDAVALAVLARAYGASDFTVAKVEDRDWVAQVRAELTPVEAGRFVVFGSHDRARIGPNRIGLEIEAAEAFGTGHHATTQGCLLALDRLARAGLRPRRIADIGCGTGVLAMGAASVWPSPAIAGDIDPLATRVARANVAANGLADRVACVTAAGFRHPRLRAGAPYDLVFANILAGPLRRMAGDMARHQRTGGRAILSGILARQAKGVAAVYRARGYVPEATVAVGEWATLLLRLGR